jgi:hypothetical protein
LRDVPEIPITRKSLVHSRQARVAQLPKNPS